VAQSDVPRRGGPPRHVSATLAPLLDRLGVAPALENARIFTDWEASVGAEIARVARPHRLDGGVLVVHVRSSAWMSELSFRRDEILGRLNARRTRRKLTQLVFRIEP
jgi:predicted nucleic acid-binding Zn ribbon protein